MTKPIKKTPATPNVSQATEPTHRQAIFKHLQTLKIPLSEEELDGIVREATAQNHSSWQLLEHFLAAPASAARERSIERRVRLAKFPDSGCLESFDWSFNAKTIPRLSV